MTELGVPTLAQLEARLEGVPTEADARASRRPLSLVGSSAD